MIVAGIGCRTGVSAEAVMGLMAEALDLLADPAVLHPLGRPDDGAAPRRVGPLVASADDETAGDEIIEALAVPIFRRDEPGLTAAAAALGLPILWIARDALKGEQGRCLTRSARAEAEVGLASVAEAAALAGAGAGARLILPRIAGHGVTCALAEGPGIKDPGA